MILWISSSSLYFCRNTYVAHTPMYDVIKEIRNRSHMGSFWWEAKNNMFFGFFPSGPFAAHYGVFPYYHCCDRSEKCNIWYSTSYKLKSPFWVAQICICVLPHFRVTKISLQTVWNILLTKISHWFQMNSKFSLRVLNRETICIPLHRFRIRRFLKKTKLCQSKDRI